MQKITVKSLHYYPVKSCAGISLQEAEIGPRGIINDRIFMIVDDEGLFFTQRDFPQLALIKAAIEGSDLIMCAPDMPQINTPIKYSGSEKWVEIWDDSCLAADQGDEVAEWLTAYMKTNCRLVTMAKDYERKVDPQYAKSSSDQVGFADGYPFLLISQESLDELNAKLKTAVPMDRFRPNIVIQGCKPGQEDTMKQIKIADVIFDLVKPCIRCVVTTTNQKTLEKSKEPLATLATYRRSPLGGVQFGQNLIHNGPGRIKAGDVVTIIQ